MQTFPKPLTPSEERILLEKSRQGDLAARNQLIERNLRLVAHIARKYQSAEDEMDDLISIGTIGLLKAAATFDLEKGSKLATYAARCIDNELLMMFRSRKKNVKEVSLYEPIGTDKEGNEIHLMDILESQDEDVPKSCERKRKHTAALCLSGQLSDAAGKRITGYALRIIWSDTNHPESHSQAAGHQPLLCLKN